MSKYVLGVSTVSATASMADVVVITAKDFENACKQPLILGLVLSNMSILVIKMIGMYALFTKINLLFNPNRIHAETRHQQFAKRANKKPAQSS